MHVAPKLNFSGDKLVKPFDDVAKNPALSQAKFGTNAEIQGIASEYGYEEAALKFKNEADEIAAEFGYSDTGVLNPKDDSSDEFDEDDYDGEIYYEDTEFMKLHPNSAIDFGSRRQHCKVVMKLYLVPETRQSSDREELTSSIGLRPDIFFYNSRYMF